MSLPTETVEARHNRLSNHLNVWLITGVRIEHIESFDLPELAPYRTLKYQLEQRRQGIFVAESEKVVRRLVESELGVLSVVVPDKWVPVYQELLARRPDAPPLFVGSKKLLESLSGFPMYQGVMAVGKVPVQPSLESILTKGHRPLLLVAADGLSNSANMGALVRNCAAFGASALLASETCCSPFIRRAVASSAGTLFRMPVIELTHLETTLKELRSRGVRCIAAHPHADQRWLAQANFSGDCCVVFGSEGDGITPEVLAQCDEAVAIPMAPGVDSLNVASATAVFLYEVQRQRLK